MKTALGLRRCGFSVTFPQRAKGDADKDSNRHNCEHVRGASQSIFAGRQVHSSFMNFCGMNAAGLHLRYRGPSRAIVVDQVHRRKS